MLLRVCRPGKQAFAQNTEEKKNLSTFCREGLGAATSSRIPACELKEGQDQEFDLHLDKSQQTRFPPQNLLPVQSADRGYAWDIYCKQIQMLNECMYVRVYIYVCVCVLYNMITPKIDIHDSPIFRFHF